MFKFISKLFPSYRTQLKEDLIAKFNATHSGQYHLYHSWKEGVLCVYLDSKCSANYSLCHWHENESVKHDFIFLKNFIPFWKHGQWYVTAASNMWDLADNMSIMPLSTYLETILPELIEKWHKECVVPLHDDEHGRIYYNERSGVVKLGLHDAPVSRYYHLFMNDIEENPAFAKYIQNTVVSTVLHEKAWSEKPDTVVATGDTTISCFIPESYMANRTEIDKAIDAELACRHDDFINHCNRIDSNRKKREHINTQVNALVNQCNEGIMPAADTGVQQQDLSAAKAIPVKVNETSKDTVSARARELEFMQLGIKYYANSILPQKGNEAIEAELPTLEKERAAIKSELKRLKGLA